MWKGSLLSPLQVIFTGPGHPRRRAFPEKAALGVTEASKLLGLIKNLKDMGLSILLITQRIPDVLAIADRVFVLKGGQGQDVLEVSKVTLDDVVTMIVRGKGRSGGPTPEAGYQSFG